MRGLESATGHDVKRAARIGSEAVGISAIERAEMEKALMAAWMEREAEEKTKGARGDRGAAFQGR